MKKERVLVVCPGRGTYTKNELGYLQQHQADHQFIHAVDGWRAALGEPTITALDGEARFSPSKHLAGEHASALIYTCAYADFLSIDQSRYEIVAVTGNSMGWYIALACAGALSPKNAFTVINTMGSTMRENIIGGQLIYPICDEHWQFCPDKYEQVQRALSAVNQISGVQAYVSIYLGGYLVLAGNEQGIRALSEELPSIDEQFPMRLNKHAAFHTPLMQTNSEYGFESLPVSLFEPPSIPLIDGRGKIWQPWACDQAALRQYTFGHQVVEPYDFTTAITVGLKEFAPDKIALLGPGATLGGAIAQVMVNHNWAELTTKEDFIKQQKKLPYLLSMGIPEQRNLLIKQ